MTDDDRRVLGRWLRAERQKRGLTSETVAEQLEASFPHVCNIERGIGSPSLDLLDRWLALFGVDLLAVLGMRRPIS